MSRICVKNLGKSTKEDELKQMFSAKGEVTDVKVMRTKDGKSRHFAFVGFRSDEQAQEAIKYFNNTFIGLSRISIELAKKLDHHDNNEEGNKRGKLKGKDKLQQLKQELEALKRPQNKKSDANKPISAVAASQPVSKKKAEFLAVATNKADLPPAEAPTAAPQDTDSSDSEGEDGSEDKSTASSRSANSSEQEAAAEQKRKEALNTMSDREYLLSKMRKDSHTSTESTESQLNTIYEDVPETNEKRQEFPAEGAEEEELDEQRVFVRNLSYTCTEEELRRHFEQYGDISEVHIPIGPEKKSKGMGYVSFIFPQDAAKALQGDGGSFQGRVLRVTPALRKHEALPAISDNRMSSFKAKKEQERKKMASMKEGWNASYVRSDTAVEALASRHSLSAADILDTSLKGGDLAVRMAIAETQVIEENQSYLTAQGVDLSILESAHSSNKHAQRSNSTLLVKNLPPNSAVEELEAMFQKFGEIASFIVPPSRTLLVVDYYEAQDCRAALKGLAYRRYKNSPLYIEYAPLGTVQKKEKRGEEKKEEKKGEKGREERRVETAEGKEKVEQQEQNSEEYSTIFIKNLNFTTTEERLKEHIENSCGCAGLRTVIIQKKNKSNVMLSMGYGFAEFLSPSSAAYAVERVHRSLLDEHQLEVKPSEKRLSSSSSAPSLSSASNKLLVKNVAFQASKQELRSLFEAFGSVKTLRMPKQLRSTLHRGFAFVEFHTKQEAARAMGSLKNTHLYGRHLVIDWAKGEEEGGFALARGEEGGEEEGGEGVQEEIERINAMQKVDKLRKRAREEVQMIAGGKRRKGRGRGEEDDGHVEGLNELV